MMTIDLDYRAHLNSQGYWEVPDGLDTSDFDFTWRPDKYDRPYIHQFGTQWQKTGGPRFIIPENEGVKYQSHQHAIKLPNTNFWKISDDVDCTGFDFSWHPDDNEPPMTYEFGTQWQKTGGPKYIVDGAVYTKYIDTCRVTKLPNMRNWRILEEIEIDKFDFSWHPDDNEPPMMYEFGTQWQSAGGPIYVMKGGIQKKYCKDQLAIRKATENRCWRPLFPNIDFDYSWHPDPNDPPYIYVFGNQWYDSATMPTLLYRVKGAQTKKYITDVKATLEVVLDDIICNDNMVTSVKNHTPQTIFTCYRDDIDVDMNVLKSIVDDRMYIHLIDNAIAIIPKEANSYLYDKMADYPYIRHHHLGYKNKPLDIVFLSNGEIIADKNYEYLLNITKDKPNRVVRIDGVNGRVASQHAAANASETAWYFLVNGKLEVNPDFDFNWQPDRFVLNRKHYIFNATNPVNGLEYGHMAIVANNKNVTLDTVVKGLDFTMDGEIEVINVNSGIALYNSSVWDTWRTAFRECIKLAYATDDDSKNRLEIWSTVANGEFGEYSIKGATDAMTYFNLVNGELDKLMLSYDWEWLHQYYQNNCS